jgi:hypothetical protein
MPNFDLQSRPRQERTPQSNTISATVNNASHKDANSGFVYVSNAQDSRTIYFGFIRAEGGSQTQSTYLNGPALQIIAKFDAPDGSYWAGTFPEPGGITDFTLTLRD